MNSTHKSILTIFSLALLSGLVFYFSWLPNPKLGTQVNMPGWLSHWTDQNENENLRTAIPFLLMGFISGIWLSTTGKKWKAWLMTWLLMILVVAIAELGQIYLPHRSFDWADIGWGAVGSGDGLIVGLLVYTGYERLNSIIKKYNSRK